MSDSDQFTGTRPVSQQQSIDVAALSISDWPFGNTLTRHGTPPPFVHLEGCAQRGRASKSNLGDLPCL